MRAARRFGEALVDLPLDGKPSARSQTSPAGTRMNVDGVRDPKPVRGWDIGLTTITPERGALDRLEPNGRVAAYARRADDRKRSGPKPRREHDVPGRSRPRVIAAYRFDGGERHYLRRAGVLVTVLRRWERLTA